MKRYDKALHILLAFAAFVGVKGGDKRLDEYLKKYEHYPKRKHDHDMDHCGNGSSPSGSNMY